MEEKKRIAIARKDGLTIKLEFEFINDEVFENSLHELAKNLKMNVGDILTYTLGTEDEMEEGTMFFCPRCGEYNEYGHEPSTNLYYRANQEILKEEPAGYFKRVELECFNCDEVFEIHTEKFNEEAAKLTESLLEKNKEK